MTVLFLLSLLTSYFGRLQTELCCFLLTPAMSQNSFSAALTPESVIICIPDDGYTDCLSLLTNDVKCCFKCSLAIFISSLKIFVHFHNLFFIGLFIFSVLLGFFIMSLKYSFGFGQRLHRIFKQFYQDINFLNINSSNPFHGIPIHILVSSSEA